MKRTKAATANREKQAAFVAKQRELGRIKTAFFLTAEEQTKVRQYVARLTKKRTDQ